VVIRVRASAFNYHDVFTVRGMPGIKVPFPMIIGLDLAGEILEVGAGVSGWKPGDRVLVNPLNKKKGLMGEMMHGGLAEKCLVAADQLIRMPDSVTFEQAASLPVVTIIGVGFALLIGGAVVTESVFAIPGLGRLTVDAIVRRDYPVVQGVVLVVSGVYVLLNLVIDVAYVVLDPRIRY